MRTIIAAAAILLMAGQAQAQTQGGAAETGAGNTVNGTNASSGSAQAANTVNVVADAGRYAPADTTARITQDGHVYSTPSVAGSYFAGANPCLVGTGGGAAGGPVGFSINVGRSDEGCTRRSDAAAWHALGLDQIAIARMCQDQKNADAFFAATGYACPGTNADTRYKLASGRKADTMALPPVAFVQSRAVPPSR
jgi:hypothetical protein